MKKGVIVFLRFFSSLCAVLAFLFLTLILGSLTGCTHIGESAATPPPPMTSFLEPSDNPVAGSSLEPTEQIQNPSESDSVAASSAPALPSQIPAESTPAIESAPAQLEPSTENSENGFQSVLQGNTPFFSSDIAQNLNINELNRAVSSDNSITTKAIKFAVVDLDNDGTSEVVLWLQVNENDAFGFEILRQQGNQFYGYTLAYRAFMDLKQDGTFSFSSGAADSGFGSIAFSDHAYTISEITYSQSAYNASNELIISYFVRGQSASESEYLSAIQQQSEKQNVSWYDFTSENIRSILK